MRSTDDPAKLSAAGHRLSPGHRTGGDAAHTPHRARAAPWTDGGTHAQQVLRPDVVGGVHCAEPLCQDNVTGDYKGATSLQVVVVAC